MRSFHQLVFSCLMPWNRQHTTKITGSNILHIKHRKSIHANTGLLRVFTLHLKPLQPFPAVSSCPPGDLECAQRCLQSSGDKSSWVEKRGLVHPGRRGFLAATGSVVWCAQWMYRGYTGLIDTFFGAYFLKFICMRWLLEELYWWQSSTYFKGINSKGFLM